MNLMQQGFVLLALTSMAMCEPKKVTKLQIGVKKRVENCEQKSRKGDKLSMHYRGTLHQDGSEFDNSYDRGEPLSFTLGSGQVKRRENVMILILIVCFFAQVIKGWDQGLLGMCVGEKRKLVIPPDLGYGDSGAGEKIPGGAALVFEVELTNIERKGEL